MGLSRLSIHRDDRTLVRARRVARGWWLTLLLCPVAGVAAQPLVLSDVEVRTLEAQANGADYSFLLARNITDHLTERGHLEPLLLVGIGYAGPSDESRVHGGR